LFIRLIVFLCEPLRPLRLPAETEVQAGFKILPQSTQRKYTCLRVAASAKAGAKFAKLGY